MKLLIKNLAGIFENTRFFQGFFVHCMWFSKLAVMDIKNTLAFDFFDVMIYVIC